MSNTELINKFVSNNLRGNVNDLSSTRMFVTNDKKKLVEDRTRTTLAQWVNGVSYVNVTEDFCAPMYMPHFKAQIRSTAIMLSKPFIETDKAPKGTRDLN